MYYPPCNTAVLSLGELSGGGDARPSASQTRAAALMAAFHSEEISSLRASMESVYCFTLVIDDQTEQLRLDGRIDDAAEKRPEFLCETGGKLPVSQYNRAFNPTPPTPPLYNTYAYIYIYSLQMFPSLSQQRFHPSVCAVTPPDPPDPGRFGGFKKKTSSKKYKQHK